MAFLPEAILASASCRLGRVFSTESGRGSFRLPEDVLAGFDPEIVVIGEVPSEHPHYSSGYNTMTQNSAAEIAFKEKDSTGTSRMRRLARAERFS